MASLFDASALNPGDAGDVGVRWSQAFTAFATVANATRAHLIANNEMAGGVTPATFEGQTGVARRIDWLVLHHGNDFVILNLDGDLPSDTEEDYRVALRERGGAGLWDFAISSDDNDADPYEMPSTQADLTAMAAVVSGGGTLDVIIFDASVAAALAGWDADALTYVAPLDLAGSAAAAPAARGGLVTLAVSTPLDLAGSAAAAPAARGGLVTLAVSTPLDLAGSAAAAPAARGGLRAVAPADAAAGDVPRAVLARAGDRVLVGADSAIQRLHDALLITRGSYPAARDYGSLLAAALDRTLNTGGVGDLANAVADAISHPANGLSDVRLRSVRINAADGMVALDVRADWISQDGTLTPIGLREQLAAG